MKRIVALVPARSGSVRISNKNLMQLDGIPLIGIAIRQACMVKEIDEVFVSTDSSIYAQVAQSFGACVPFLRPSDISQSDSTDYDVFDHFLKWFKEHYGYLPELIVQIRPTAPMRSIQQISEAILFMQTHKEFDSLRTVSIPHQNPFKMWYMNDAHVLSPVVSLAGLECYDRPTQGLPTAYEQDGVVDIVRSKTIIDFKSMSGKCIAGWKNNCVNSDIDTIIDFNRVNKLFSSDNLNKLLYSPKAVGFNLGITQGRLSDSDTLQKFPTAWEREFDLARMAGYTSIEWLRDKNLNVNNPIWDKELDIIGIQRQSIASGVGIRSICDDYVQTCDWKCISFPQINNLISLVLKAARMGVRTIVYPMFEKASLASESDIQCFTRHINMIGSIAQELGIRIALEISMDSEKLECIFDGINLANIGLCLDTGNLYNQRIDIFEILNNGKLNKYIFHIHIKDRDCSGRNVKLGNGCVDLKGILKCLLEIGYKGLLITETDRGMDPFVTAIENKKHIMNLLNSNIDERENNE